MRIGYMNWTQEKFYVTLIEKYRKGNEYAYRIYELNTRKILCHTDSKISKMVTDIKSTNWTQSPVD